MTDYKAEAEKRLNERASIFEKRKAIVDSDATDAEKREQTDRMDADMDRLFSEAEEIVREGERESETRALMTRAGALGNLSTPDRDNTDERTLHDDLRDLANGEVRSVDLMASVAAMENRAEVAGTAKAEKGQPWAGPLNADTFVRVLLESLEDSSAVLSKVRRLATASGELMEWPRRVSKAGNIFQAIAENGTYPKASNGGFDRFPLNAYKFGAIAEVTEEAISDLALPIGQIVAEDCGEDLAESLATAVWTGTGTNEPHGLLPAAVNGVTFAAGTAITEDELIDLQHSIISKYRGNAEWYLNDDTAKFVRKIKDANEHYLWQPALVAGQPDTLLGKPVNTDYNVPAIALNAQSVVFGDVRRAYVLRTVRDIQIVRSTEYGFDRDTVALKVKWRGDGDVSDPAAYAVGTMGAA